jgi:2-dehydropantoate 2-reductase
MKWLVMGAGGVGGYFGGRLAQAGHEVWLVARGAHREALTRRGLRVSSILGDFEVTPAGVVENVADAGRADAVLFAVKSWQTEAAARALAPALGPGTAVLSLQNGATAAAEIGAVVGMGPMLGGVCRIMAYLSAPGHVTHAGVEPAVVLGELDGSRSARAQAVADAFASCRGVSVELSDDIQREIWTKFLFISAISGVGAVSRVPAGRLRSTPETRRLLEAAMREVEAIARARGVALAADVVEATLRFVDGLPEDATASMQRDVMAGRPSELEAQTGAVVRLGRELGVATPVNDFLYAALSPQEARVRERGTGGPAEPTGGPA